METKDIKEKEAKMFELPELLSKTQRQNEQLEAQLRNVNTEVIKADQKVEMVIKIIKFVLCVISDYYGIKILRVISSKLDTERLISKEIDKYYMPF